MEETGVATTSGPAQIINAADPMAMAISVDQIMLQIGTIQKLMSQAMVLDTHYGTIPGCGKKPSLFKPGAEKLAMMFRLIPEYVEEMTDLGDDHREYKITTYLRYQGEGPIIGMGFGICTTKETKYRFRKGEAQVEIIGGAEAIPKDYKENKGKYAAQGLRCKKSEEGAWQWVKETGSARQIENPNIADSWNTVLKMAKKRAFVDAVLTGTAASDIFTQDIEDFREVLSAPPPVVDRTVVTPPAAAQPAATPVATPAAAPVTTPQAPAAAAVATPAAGEVTEDMKAAAVAAELGEPVAAEVVAPVPNTPAAAAVATPAAPAAVAPATPTAAAPAPTGTPGPTDTLHPNQVQSILTVFQKFGIGQAALEQVINEPVDTWNGAHRLWMLNQYRMLKDNAMKPEEFKALTYGG